MKLVIVSGDDWAGVYIDGKLVYENHSIDWEYVVMPRLAKAFGFDFETREANEDDLEMYGGLPTSL